MSKQQIDEVILLSSVQDSIEHSINNDLDYDENDPEEKL